MKKQKQPTIKELIEERNRLLVDKSNPKRLKEIEAKLDYFYYGIK